jgi:hypothetical protein
MISAVEEISANTFESIVSKLAINKVSISDYHITTPHSKSSADLGITTHCESSDREIMILHFHSDLPRDISHKITLSYNPIATINRSCLFVKPDDVNQLRLERIIENSADIKFIVYDVNHPDSMVNLFKDAALEEDIYEYNGPGTDYDLVILFRTPNIRTHLRQIQDVYNNPYTPMGPAKKGLNKRKEEIIDKYVVGMSPKNALLLVVITVVFIACSIYFGVDDNSSQLPETVEISNAVKQVIQPSNVIEMD